MDGHRSIPPRGGAAAACDNIIARQAKIRIEEEKISAKKGKVTAREEKIGAEHGWPGDAR